jgi:signal transduction histidine kinase
MIEPDPERKLVIVRTAQEALTNVQKHAAASRVELALVLEGGAYVLTCRDDGRGPAAAGDPPAAPPGSGFGLGSLRSRAAAFGGRVALESAPGGGALLRLTLPAAQEKPHA